MDARQGGFIFGFLFSQLIYVIVFALVIGAIIYFVGGKKNSFMKTVLSWKALVPAFLLVGLIAFSQFAKVSQAYSGMDAMNAQSSEAGATTAASTGWNAEQTSGFTAICSDSLKKKSAPTDKITSICGCAVDSAKKQFANFADMEKAIMENKGMPESIKESMMTCVQASGA